MSKTYRRERRTPKGMSRKPQRKSRRVEKQMLREHKV